MEDLGWMHKYIGSILWCVDRGQNMIFGEMENKSYIQHVLQVLSTVESQESADWL